MSETSLFRHARVGARLAVTTAVLAALVLPAQSASGASVPTTQTVDRSLSSVDKRIASKVAERARDPRLGKDLAIRILDPATGTTVYTSQSLEAQLAASNTKIITAFVSLKRLGATTRITTKVLRDPGRTWVKLVGAGDPFLTSARYDELAANTVRGLKEASSTGRAPSSIKVYYNDSLFPKHVNATGWRSSYLPGEVNPVSPLQRYGAHTMYPSLDAAKYFASRLSARGVKATVIGRTSSLYGTTVGLLRGTTILTSAQKMLHVSDNNIAEMLARLVAIKSGRPATYAGWRRAAHATLESAGVPMTGVSLVDGSGLTRVGTLSAKAIAWTLTRGIMSKESALSGFQSAFPIAGRSGTIDDSYGRYNTYPTRCAAGKIWAKTGHIQGVYALSGVAIAADGRKRVFSFVANYVPYGYSGLEIRRALDRLAATVVGCY
jgi:D-alanyl-D-alanine carboxypeptidase/D-alanyl-D-alanine-endopeptidase (penicillin-binding protein 4)